MNRNEEDKVIVFMSILVIIGFAWLTSYVFLGGI